MDMGFILISKVTDGGEDGVGSSLSQTAKGAASDYLTELYQQLNVPGLACTFGDIVQNPKHLLCSQPAGEALAAGLPPGEVEEVTGHIHHAGILIHHHHPPPEPIIDPAAVRESKSTGMSNILAGRTPPGGLQSGPL